MRDTYVVSVDKHKNRFHYYAGDLSTSQMEQIRKSLVKFSNQLEDNLRTWKEDYLYYHSLLPETKLQVAVELVHDIMRGINQILFLKPYLDNKNQCEEFEKVESQFQSLLKRTVYEITRDEHVNIVYPCVLAVLGGEDIRNMKPLFETDPKKKNSS